MDRLDKSLDDLIKENPRFKKNSGSEKGRNGGSGGTSGKARAAQSKEVRKPQPYNNNSNNNFNNTTVIKQPFMKEVVSQQPQRIVQPFHVQPQQASQQQQQQSVPVSIFERIGTSGPAGQAGNMHVSGTYVTISNLNMNVTIADLSELCGNVGEVKSVEFISSGSSQHHKVAKVLFARRSDALKCINKFHGITLDGTPMEIKLSGENGKENPFNPFHDISPVMGHPNVRAGLFGTALQDFEMAPEAEEQDHAVIFRSVSAKGAPNFNVTVSDNFDGGRENSFGREKSFGRNSSGGRSNSRQNSFRGGKGGGGGGGRGSRMNADQTDEAFDAYMAAR